MLTYVEYAPLFLSSQDLKSRLLYNFLVQEDSALCRFAATAIAEKGLLRVVKGIFAADLI